MLESFWIQNKRAHHCYIFLQAPEKFTELRIGFPATL
jgi:hypothetical protein